MSINQPGYPSAGNLQELHDEWLADKEATAEKLKVQFTVGAVPELEALIDAHDKACLYHDLEAFYKGMEETFGYPTELVTAIWMSWALSVWGRIRTLEKNRQRHDSITATLARAMQSADSIIIIDAD